MSEHWQVPIVANLYTAQCCKSAAFSTAVYILLNLLTSSHSVSIYTPGSRDALRMNCLAQEHNVMSMKKVWSRTTGFWGQCTYHEAIMSPSGSTAHLLFFVSQLSCPYMDADNFHSEGNITKMKQGTPLTDEVYALRL